MKKNIFLFITILLLVISTGCAKKGSSGGGILSGNKTMTCTKEETDESGYKTNEKMDIVYNSKKVVKVTSTNTTEMDSMVIDFAISAGTEIAKAFDKVDGISVKYTQENTNTIKYVMEIEFDKLKEEQLQQLINDLYGGETDAENLFDKKDVTIEEFRKDNLEGYTCTEN